MYATNESGTWEIELLKDDAWDVYMPLVIDENDAIHTTCSDINGMYYLTNESGSWVTDLIDLDGIEAPTLALDFNDHIHVAYKAAGNDLYYSNNESGTWESILIDDGHVFDYSLDTDSAGAVHMTYYDNDVDEFNYVIISNGVPTYETLFTYVDAEWDQVLVDENDYVHSVWEYNDHYTNYTTDMTGSMMTTDKVLPGSPARFDMDDSDQLHFVFQMNGGLWYAVVPKGYVNP